MGRILLKNFLKIISVGNSEGIIIPKRMLDDLSIKKNDYVMVTLEKLSKKEVTERLKKLKKDLE